MEQAMMTTEGRVGLAAVLAAARLCEAVRVEMVHSRERRLDKPDGSPVTIADLGAQALVCRLLAESFPEDAVVGEEDSAILRQSAAAGQLTALTRFVAAETGAVDLETIFGWIDRGTGNVGPRYWTLDPIDGTKGFLRSQQYAVALALVNEGSLEWGFLGCRCCLARAAAA